MPASRLARRRRSSLALSFMHAKAGVYGIPRPVTFAPNVTPVSYVAPEDGASSSTTPEPDSPGAQLFPPSEAPASAPMRRRVPPGKRRSLGYIPRPPNAFMLFRADFVRQKHVPGSIETNHGSLSKIIGNCWRALPLEEKRIWEIKAKHAKAEHKLRYPDYRFRPVHNKNKEKKKDKPTPTPEDERRCEEVAQLLLEGKKGDELAAAVRSLDLIRQDSKPQSQAQFQPELVHPQPMTATLPQPIYPHRRSSSVPLPNDYYPFTYGNSFVEHDNIALPTLPFFSAPGRSDSPSSLTMMSQHHQMMQQQRIMLGQRRASSAQPFQHFTRSWTMPFPGTVPTSLQRDDSPLPEVDTSLFEQSFLDPHNPDFAFSVPNIESHHPPNFDPLLNDIAPTQTIHNDPNVFLGPLDPIVSTQQPSSQSNPSSHPSTAYSGSPSPAGVSDILPTHFARPADAHVFTDMWKGFDAPGHLAFTAESAPATAPPQQSMFGGTEMYQDVVPASVQERPQHIDGFALGLQFGNPNHSEVGMMNCDQTMPSQAQQPNEIAPEFYAVQEYGAEINMSLPTFDGYHAGVAHA